MFPSIQSIVAYVSVSPRLRLKLYTSSSNTCNEPYWT